MHELSSSTRRSGVRLVYQLLFTQNSCNPRALRSFPKSTFYVRHPGGGGGTWVKFCWVCAAGILEPLPHHSLFLVYFLANYKLHLSHFWANYFLTLKVPKKCDPILVTLLKRRPHYSQSSRENATPSSGTSPVAHY